MKRVRTVIAAVVVVAIVAIAAFFLLGSNKDATWHNGDYVEYTWSTGPVNGTTGEPNLIQTYTVTGVDGGKVTVNLTYMDMSRQYLNSTTFTFGTDRPLSTVNSWISDGLSAYVQTYVEKDVISTTKGNQSVDRYLWTYSGTSVTADVWMEKGIIMKKTIHWTTFTHIVTLTGSNVSMPDQ